MEESALRDLVVSHDKHIDLMAQSIEHLAGAVGITSKKLDDIIGVITKQNILMEKFQNLEGNLRESFDRVHTKISKLEEVQNGSGCAALKANTQADNGRDARLKKLEASLTWVVRLIIGALVSGMIGTLFILARG